MSEAPPPNHPVRTQLLVSALDKLLLGGVAALVAVLIKIWVIDPRESRSAFHEKVAEMRVQKIALLWQALDAQQQAIVELQESYEHTNDMIRNNGGVNNVLRIPQLRKQIAESLRANDERGRRIVGKLNHIRSVLASDRLWIGERLFPKYAAYLESEARTAVAIVLIGEAPTAQACVEVSGQSKQCINVPEATEQLQGQLRKDRESLAKARAALISDVESLP